MKRGEEQREREREREERSRSGRRQSRKVQDVLGSASIWSGRPALGPKRSSRGSGAASDMEACTAATILRPLQQTQHNTPRRQEQRERRPGQETRASEAEITLTYLRDGSQSKDRSEYIFNYFRALTSICSKNESRKA